MTHEKSHSTLFNKIDLKHFILYVSLYSFNDKKFKAKISKNYRASLTHLRRIRKHINSVSAVWLSYTVVWHTIYSSQNVRAAEAKAKAIEMKNKCYDMNIQKY